MTSAILMIAEDNQCCYHQIQLVKNDTCSLENDSEIPFVSTNNLRTIKKHNLLLKLFSYIYKTLNINFDLLITFKIQKYLQTWIPSSDMSWKSDIARWIKSTSALWALAAILNFVIFLRKLKNILLISAWYTSQDIWWFVIHQEKNYNSRCRVRQTNSFGWLTNLLLWHPNTANGQESRIQECQNHYTRAPLTSCVHFQITY